MVNQIFMAKELFHLRSFEVFEVMVTDASARYGPLVSERWIEVSV